MLRRHRGPSLRVRGTKPRTEYAWDNLEASFKDDLESLVYVMTHLIGKGKVFTLQRFQLEWITEAEFLRWKSCEFFKEMIKLIPP